jgi:hypothetical protein
MVDFSVRDGLSPTSKPKRASNGQVRFCSKNPGNFNPFEASSLGCTTEAVKQAKMKQLVLVIALVGTLVGSQARFLLLYA